MLAGHRLGRIEARQGDLNDRREAVPPLTSCRIVPLSAARAGAVDRAQ
jgi:hypothetical protein